MGMNCGYGCSKPGILKIVTVLLGLVIWIWIGTVIHNSEYFSTENDADHEKFCEEYLTEGGSNADKNKFTDITKKDDNKYVAKYKAPCPKKAYIYTAGALAFFSFLGSIIALLLLLCVELNKNGLFNQIDFIGHFVAGFLNVVGAILAFVYVALVYGKYPIPDCEDLLGEDLKKKCEEKFADDFHPISFAICGGLIFVNGIIYYVLGVVIQRAKT